MNKTESQTSFSSSFQEKNKYSKKDAYCFPFVILLSTPRSTGASSPLPPTHTPEMHWHLG